MPNHRDQPARLRASPAKNLSMVRPPGQRHPPLQTRLLTLLATGTVVLALAAGGAAFAAQPAKTRTCRVALVDKDLLNVDCPKGRLGEFLAALHQQTGMEADVSAELAATPVSVVLDKSTLQAVLDVALARYNYSLDGTPMIVGGRAAGTKVVVVGLREASGKDAGAPAAADAPPAMAEPGPPPHPQDSPPPIEAAAEEPARPGPAEPASADAASAAPGLPAVDPEIAAKAREAFFANLPPPGATLPQGPAQVELPPSRPIHNSTGPGDGRRGLPLPDFTPGPPTRTPPGANP